jgi:hypothetical protein
MMRSVNSLSAVIPAERDSARAGIQVPLTCAFHDAGVLGSWIGLLAQAVRDDSRTGCNTKLTCRRRHAP